MTYKVCYWDEVEGCQKERDATPEEQAEIDAWSGGAEAQKTPNKAAEVRSERNAKLAASDWTQLIDAPVDRQAWVVYRQALRDISAQAGFPWDVQWPVQP